MSVVPLSDHSACGCDDASAASLISVEEAMGRIEAHAQPVTETEVVAITDALGRILASPVAARSDLPPFSNSAMDGYAVSTASFSGSGPWYLAVQDRVPAGQVATAGVKRGVAARIFTGAPIPQGADTVIMQERVERTAQGVLIHDRPEVGANIRHAGEELKCGTEILAAGTGIGTREIAACAAAGVGQVEVNRRVRIALLVTGDEIQPAGTDLNGAGIWDVNTPMLTAALTRPDIQLTEIVHCPDDRPQLIRLIRELSLRTDVLITSGAVSVGEEDHVKPALNELGLKTHFSGVAIKPGKPVSFGRVGNLLWLGLPGNPLSAFVTWQLFGRALIARLTGDVTRPVKQLVKLKDDVTHKIGRAEYHPAQLLGNEAHDYRTVRCGGAVHSGRISALPKADGLVVIPAEEDFLPGGAVVEFLPFQDC